MFNKKTQYCFYIVALLSMQHSVADISVNAEVDITREQIKKLPTDDIWWTVYGEDMLWNFKNLNKIFPTNTVYRNGPVKNLPLNISKSIANTKIQTPKGPMAFESFLHSDLSTAISMIIVHKGEIVYESYPRMKPHEKPVFWSVAKVFAATLVAMLEEQGNIDTTLPIDLYLPELKGSDFEGILVQNILDMATGIKCSEEYENKEACYYVYSSAIGDGFWTAESPDNPYEFVAKLKVGKFAEQGQQYDYSGVNTFILGWLVEKTTGLQFQDALSEMIWTKIGAEADAAFFAPRFGVPITHGGFLARPKDVARFGLLFTPSFNKVSDKRLISEKYINKLLYSGRPSLITKPGTPSFIPGLKHNIDQWDMVFENGNVFKGGWAGQGLIVNPTEDYVVVWNSYFKDKQMSETKLTPVVFELMSTLYKNKSEL